MYWFVQCSTPNQSRKGGRNSGGIALLYKNKLDKNIVITKTTQNYVWFVIKKDLLNSMKDIHVCGIYIPPCNSKYFDPEIFDQLEQDIIDFSPTGSIILMGDFNSRTGKYSDTVSQEGNNVISNDQSETAFQPAHRNSFDNVINSHGKRLLEICKTLDLRIVNGRANGDTLGRPTFHGKNGTSVIDYVICDQFTLLNVNSFVVKQPSYLSDHSAIVAWLNVNNSLPTNNTQTSNSTDRLTSLPRQFCWESDSYLKFRNTLRMESIQILIREYMERHTEDVNVSLDDAVNILTATSKICLKIKTKKSRKRVKATSNKKWFDRECRLKRHELRRVSNQKQRDPFNSELREKFHKTLTDYKKLLDSKRNAFQTEKSLKLDELGLNPNKASFWNYLKSMNNTIVENVPAPISEETWLNHFQSLHSNDPRTSTQQQEIYNELQSLEKEKEQLNYLDHTITEQEIRQAVKKLKNEKSPFLDKIRNEMIKASLESLMPVYIKLFNLILQSGKMPDIWCQGLITPIYKSGDKGDPTNYRGICVSSCLGKLFSSILNQRLYLYFEENKILHNSQIGFLPENRTADHVFTLRTLIDKYVHYHKEKVYACFVDFRKAFDSVWDEGLFYKLLKINIGGHFYNLIKTLYCSSTCSIRIGENKTRSFSYSRGVRQGCILSPLLFNLYINNLPYLFENTMSDPFILPNGTKVNSLLHADDLIILSRSKIGLQNCLNALSSYCETWMLKIHPKKTKIMIFQKRPRKSVDTNFKIGTEMIEIVQEYTYLGTRLTPTGNFTLAQEHLKEKALHAFSSIRKHTPLHRLNPNTASKIFDTMIFPILSYNSEVWGIYTTQDFKKWDNSAIEKIHLKFCKRYLEVNNKDSNLACRAELPSYYIYYIYYTYYSTRTTATTSTTIQLLQILQLLHLLHLLHLLQHTYYSYYIYHNTAITAATATTATTLTTAHVLQLLHLLQYSYCSCYSYYTYYTYYTYYSTRTTATTSTTIQLLQLLHLLHLLQHTYYSYYSYYTYYTYYSTRTTATTATTIQLLQLLHLLHLLHLLQHTYYSYYIYYNTAITAATATTPTTLTTAHVLQLLYLLQYSYYSCYSYYTYYTYYSTRTTATTATTIQLLQLLHLLHLLHLLQHTYYSYYIYYNTAITDATATTPTTLTTAHVLQLLQLLQYSYYRYYTYYTYYT